ncbi:trimeric LpxA-like domain-containing protein [Cavenderia fasciculata]|uniref:Trimeric LpxA-like domain-containing protein n=1 Tax=Cavenderia fasciculata TaxID=261658 RepID=F4QBD1_CACFS|nr:trimeric LpxA-like domain-containing protein [Cavenderia fasciculata]EGG14903.1 trimeric LpxA-like domain-containing protein [Cavenderia fasciculata]|eukprot:XP_004351419.1 trimeric LpxA-like domain-containing protein [Cavenderia fasciculata]
MLKNVFYLVGDAVRSTGKALDVVGRNMQGNYAYVEQLNRQSRVTPLRGKLAHLGKDSFVAPNSSVIGQVTIGNNSALWYNTVVRGDVNQITVGNETSIGDRTVIHASSKNGPKGEQATQIGSRVLVGSGAILHGCVIEDGANIGSGSIVYDGAVVEKGAHLEAGSLVASGKRVPAGQLWGGSPARFIRDVTAQEKSHHDTILQDTITLSAEHEAQHAKSAKQQHMEYLDYLEGIEDDIRAPRNKYQEPQ